MPSRNERRKRALDADQYSEFKRKKHERNLGNKVDSAEAELARLEEKRKSDLAALEA